jgi:AcrR family transcriptional regulator
MLSSGTMVMTPWGPSESLRTRMLSRDPGTPPKEVARNQRERFFGAMVASVFNRGYAATRVSDLVELSGVSSRTFYDLFPDKQACLAATIEELLSRALDRSSFSDEGATSWEEQARRWLKGIAQIAVEQPAAARLCLIESYTAGPEVMKPVERTIGVLERRARQKLKSSPEHAGMPAEMVSALVGAILEVARTRLRQGREAELPRLAEDLSQLVLSYRPPPEPLRLMARPPKHGPESLEAYDHSERTLRAFAVVVTEQGYANTTIEQVVKRASMSATTFYLNFAGKEDAMLAAIDRAGAEIVAAAMPAFRRGSDWPTAVRRAFGAILNFLASRPAMTHLMAVEVYAAGPKAIERRAKALKPLSALVAEGRRRSPTISPGALEGIGGAIYSLAYRKIRRDGPATLPALAPICSYMTLSPFIGAERACAAANERPSAKGMRDPDPLWIQAMSTDPVGVQVLTIFSERIASPETVSAEIEVPVEEVERQVEKLQKAGFVEPATEGERSAAGERLYRLKLLRSKGEYGESLKLLKFDPEYWERMSLEEHEHFSAEFMKIVRREADRAIAAKTFAVRTERVLLHTPVLVDEKGWRELSELHLSAGEAVLEIQATSTDRLRKTEGGAINARSIVMLFEMPLEDP